MNNEQQIVELARAFRAEEWYQRWLDGTWQYKPINPKMIAMQLTDLLDLIDPPQPVGVDWGKPVRFRATGTPVEVSTVRTIDGLQIAALCWMHSGNLCATTASPHDERFENFPEPPDTAPIVEEYEVCLASNHGLHAPLFRLKGSHMVCSFGGNAPLAEWQQGGWTFGPWHSRTVTH